MIEAVQGQNRYPTRQFLTVSNISGERRWRSDGGGRLYTWDSLHGEVEVFNARGKHLGALNAVTGAWIKPAVLGRMIDV